MNSTSLTVSPRAAHTAWLRVGQEDHPAQVKDLSLYGVTLRTPLIVPAGTFLPLRFQIGDDDEVRLHGVVTSARPRFHVRFEGLSARQFDELAALVADVRRRGGESTQPLIEREGTDEVDVRAQIAALSAEIARLRADFSIPPTNPEGNPAPPTSSPPSASPPASSSSGSTTTSTKALPPPYRPKPFTSTPTIVALLAAIDPMLWGLEEAVKHFETTSPPSPESALHLRHLRLLEALLRRLNDEVQRP